MFNPLCFSQLASSSLLKIGQETDKTTTRNRESVYLLLDMVRASGLLLCYSFFF